MTPEMRREMIIRTALPMVAEHGTAVTTGQIARAAGIGEATIFRVFADKAELLDACVLEVLRPDTLLAELADIPMDQPLASRLVEAGAALRAHMGRMGAVTGALRMSGHGRERRPAPESEEGRRITAGRDDSAARVRAALADLMRPDEAALRLPADRLAAAFGSLIGAGVRPAGGDDPTLEETVDLFLNGAVAR